MYISLMLWKRADEKWTNDELVPVKGIQHSATKDRVTILFKNGDKKVLSFD